MEQGEGQNAEGIIGNMFNSLSQFYTSDIWRSLRTALIAERVNPKDGILYDEHNGQPLLKSYDIVAHHKIPLTMANVNDYSISLNPENIMLVSHRSHNEIHARYGFAMLKKVYYVYGAPCSGKTTFVRESKGNSDLVLDIDLIWQAVTGGALYEKPDALKAAVFALHDTLLDIVKTRMGKWERAWVLSADGNKAARERSIKALGAEPIEIDTDKETCLARLHKNPNGRNVEMWTGFIEKYFERN